MQRQRQKQKDMPWVVVEARVTAGGVMIKITAAPINISSDDIISLLCEGIQLASASGNETR